MKTAHIVAQLGLYAQAEFLDLVLCSEMRSEIDGAAQVCSKVYRGGESILDEHERRSLSALVSDRKRSLIRRRLDALIPQLEAHFDVTLRGCQPPSFLVYAKGDHFKPHTDSGAGPGTPQYISKRKLSAVIFLNRGCTKPSRGCYCGGALTLYNLVDNPDSSNVRTPVLGEEGLLMVFPSEVFHEVCPVTWGQRYTIVSWFF